MLASITPLGERGRQRSWGRTVTAFFLGSVAGGAALGAVCAALAALAGRAAPSVRWPVAGAVALVVVALAEAGRLPQWRRQVDVRWLGRYRGWVVGLGYGAQLGAAVVTIVPSVATWLVLVLAIASGSVVVAVTLCLVFAAVRAAPLLLGARVQTPQALHELHERLERWAGPAARLARATSICAAAGVVAMAATTGAS